jgi:transposase-like protein
MPKRFDQEFKEQMQKLALAKGNNYYDIADEYGIGHSTLDKWVKEAKQSVKLPNHNGLTDAEYIKLLEGKLVEADTDIETLKKSIAILAVNKKHQR